MTPGPEMLLAFDREVAWPESHGTLRRITGPVLEVPAEETLTWFDPVDGRPQARSEVEAGRMNTFVTAVEWPDGYPDGLSGAAVGLGDPAMVALWTTPIGDDGEPAWFSTDRGVGCVAISRWADAVARLVEDLSFMSTLLASIRAAPIHPLEVGGEVVGIAFHCGMGASTNRLHVGQDATGRVVAVLADLDLLTGADLAH